MKSDENRDPGFLRSLKELSLWKKILRLAVLVVSDPTRFWRDIEHLTPSATLLGVLFFVLLSFLVNLSTAWYGSQGLEDSQTWILFSRRFLLELVLLRALFIVGFWFLLAIFIKLFSPAFDVAMSQEKARRVSFGAMVPLTISMTLCNILFLPVGLVLLIIAATIAYAIYIVREGLSEVFSVPRTKSLAYALLSFGVASAVFLLIGSLMTMMIYLSWVSGR